MKNWMAEPPSDVFFFSDDGLLGFEGYSMLTNTSALGWGFGKHVN